MSPREKRPSWLPKPAKLPKRSGRKWRPLSLKEAGVDVTQRSYLLVEEMLGEPLPARVGATSADPRLQAAAHERPSEVETDAVVSVRVADWPAADSDGLPLFGDPEAEREVSIFYGDLQVQLDQIRKLPGSFGTAAPDAVRRRPIRSGDAFAVKVDQRAFETALASEELQYPDWLLEAYDITADARDAIRQAFYAAVTPELGAQALREIRQQQFRNR